MDLLRRSARRCTVYIFLLLVVLCSPVLSISAEEQQEKSLEPEQSLSIISAYSWTNTLPRELIDLQNDVETASDLNPFKKSLPELSEQIDTLEWEVISLKSDPNLTYHDLISFETKLVKINSGLDKINDPINSHIKHLEKWYKDWLGKEKQLQVLIEQIKTDPELHVSFSGVDSLTETIEAAKQLIEEQIKPNLLAGQQIGENQTRVYVLRDTVRNLLTQIKKAGTQQTSPPMLSAEFYKNINKQIFFNGWQNIRIFLKYQWSYVKQHFHIIALCSFLILALTILIHFSKYLTKPSAKWYSFTATPLASALLIIGTGFTILNSLEINLKLPPDWETLLYIPPILAVIFLIDSVYKKHWQTKLLKQLLIFLCITLLMTVINLPQMLNYLLIFYLSVALLSYYFLLFAKRMMVPSQRRINWAMMLWAFFPLSVIITGVAGFDQFAVLMFGRVLALVGATLIVWFMAKLLSGVVELVLTNTPVKLIRHNANTIVSAITPGIFLAHAVFWLALVLNIVWLYPTLNASFSAITSLQFSFFSVSITPGSILTVVFIIYAALLLSRGIRAFLMQEVLPRYKVEQGAQISITRLVHYAILFTGFLILLSALGFGLNQITILGGALGVGIGFGLQAIVNNFVSGLILLFERPIKVGDMIEVGTDVGEVKELGLRATIVQTFDNAEIVIPNSQLITGSVINWTLAEKKIRVRVPVGVAYGSDITAVLGILLACANDNAHVLSTPKPAALFLAFGASSLDFELRVWISDFNDKLTVRSELNQDIEYEFSRAGIEIPFPQSDLHLRSVDDGLITKFRGR